SQFGIVGSDVGPCLFLRHAGPLQRVQRDQHPSSHDPGDAAVRRASSLAFRWSDDQCHAPYVEVLQRPSQYEELPLRLAQANTPSKSRERDESINERLPFTARLRRGVESLT